MKKEIIDIPEVNLSDVKEFWVLGSQYKDGILGEYNLKIDVKAAVSGGGSSDSDSSDDLEVLIDLSNYEVPVDSISGTELNSNTVSEIFSRIEQLDLEQGDEVLVAYNDASAPYTLTNVTEGGGLTEITFYSSDNLYILTVTDFGGGDVTGYWYYSGGSNPK